MDSLLRVEIRHQAGALALDVAFTLTAPWTVLFGASGSGKTTVLRTIAGFVRPDAGRVVLGEETLVDTVRKVFVPSHRRAVRSAGQTPRLFAGMTVRGNLLYGASAPAIDEVVKLFRLDGVMQKMSEALSGGERQRVSAARAVASAAARPGALLLLDEPFGGLDFALRDVIARELRSWLEERRVPVLSVTHDVGEAFLLGAEIVRIAGGRVLTQGSAMEVLAEERTRLLTQLRLHSEGPPERQELPRE